MYKSQRVETEDFIRTTELVSQAIDSTSNGSTPKILGFRDYNMNQIKWIPGSTLDPLSQNSHDGRQANAIIKLINDHLLYQEVNQPTRLHNILDLVFTNDQSLVANISQEVNTIISDHNTLTILMNIYPGSSKKIHKNKDYLLTDLHKLDMR